MPRKKKTIETIAALIRERHPDVDQVEVKASAYYLAGMKTDCTTIKYRAIWRFWPRGRGGPDRDIIRDSGSIEGLYDAVALELKQQRTLTARAAAAAALVSKAKAHVAVAKGKRKPL